MSEIETERLCRRCRKPIPPERRRDTVYHEACRYAAYRDRQQPRALPPAASPPALPTPARPLSVAERGLMRLQALRREWGLSPLRPDSVLSAMALVKAAENAGLRYPTVDDMDKLSGTLSAEEIQELEAEALERPLDLLVGIAAVPSGHGDQVHLVILLAPQGPR